MAPAVRRVVAARKPEASSPTATGREAAPQSLPPRSTARPRLPGGEPVRLLLGAPETAQSELRRALQGIADVVVECRRADDVERHAIATPIDVAVCFAQLEGGSTLQVLARLRGEGHRLPFVVVTAQHGRVFRVMVSDSSGTVLSSRVLDPQNLGILVAGLVESHRTAPPPSSRR